MEQLIPYISKKINKPIRQWKALSGGDISSVFLLETAVQHYILKTNRNDAALTMFQAEQLGLATIGSTATIKTPQIFLCEKVSSQ